MNGGRNKTKPYSIFGDCKISPDITADISEQQRHLAQLPPHGGGDFEIQTGYHDKNLLADVECNFTLSGTTLQDLWFTATRGFYPSYIRS